MKAMTLATDIKRLIGVYTQEKEGPLLIVMGGIHGNEHAGIHALQNVFDKLAQYKPSFNGIIVGVTGNVTAAEQGVRFIDIDLNRQWYPKKVDKIKRTPKNELKQVEDIQQKELLQLFAHFKRRYSNYIRNHPVLLLDLHTFSANDNVAYSIATHIGKSKEWASLLHVPVVIGLESVLRGTTMHFFNDLEMTSFGFEAGQHYDTGSIERTEAVIWLTLANVGCIATMSIPNFNDYHKILQKIGGRLPKTVRLLYRHAISPSDEFQMHPGYRNFMPVKEGELLAKDIKGDIHAPFSGLILMPLYQKQGEDGFFIVEQTSVY